MLNSCPLAAMPILPAHDRLYTIIGSVTRHFLHPPMTVRHVRCRTNKQQREAENFATAWEEMRNERADTEDPHRVDVARPLVRRAMAAGDWRLARRAGACDRSG